MDDEIDWQPLERAVPRAWLGGWMFMGYVSGPPGEPLRVYKHGITRRALHLRIQDGRLEAYRAAGGGRFRPAVLDEEVEAAYAGIGDHGARRETDYDEAYVAERERRLRAQGWTVVRFSGSG
jgi:hypothetical protein